MATLARRRQLRGPRIGDSPTLRAAAQRDDRWALVHGGIQLFEAIADKRERQAIIAEEEHAAAGQLLSLQLKDQFTDWQNAQIAEGGLEGQSSQEMLATFNSKIKELTGRLSQHPEQQAILDADLSVLASRPVTARRQQEHEANQQRLFATLSKAHDRVVTKGTEYVNAFASGNQEEAELAYQELQMDLRDRTAARRLAMGKGFDSDQQALLDQENQQVIQSLTRDAFRQKAAREGWTNDLYSSAASNSDTFGPEGTRIFEGVTPAERMEMMKKDLALASAIATADERKEEKAKGLREASHKAMLTGAKELALGSRNVMEASYTHAMVLEQQGFTAEASELRSWAKTRQERISSGADMILSESRGAIEAGTSYGLDLWGVTDEGRLAELEGQIEAAAGTAEIGSKQHTMLKGLLSAKRRALQAYEGEDADASKAFRRISGGVVKQLGGMPDTAMLWAQGPGSADDVDVAHAAFVQDVFDQAEEFYMEGLRTPADARQMRDLATYVVQSATGYGMGGEDARQAANGRLARTLHALSEQGKGFDTPKDLAGLMMPQEVYNVVAWQPDGHLPDFMETDRRLQAIYGPDRAKIYLDVIAPIANLWEAARDKATVGELMEQSTKYSTAYERMRGG